MLSFGIKPKICFEEQNLSILLQIHFVLYTLSKYFARMDEWDITLYTDNYMHDMKYLNISLYPEYVEAECLLGDSFVFDTRNLRLIPLFLVQLICV